MQPPMKCPSPCLLTMVDLFSLQRQAHGLLKEIAPCFLRVCAGDEAIWVCDLPRKTDVSGLELQGLEELGLCATVDETTRLFMVDLSLASYRSLSETVDAASYAFPEDYRLFPAYSLCRLLLNHPAQLEHQPMNLNRRILKMLSYPKLYDDAAPVDLLSECSALLRRHMPLPYLGGRLLAAALLKKGDFPCCLNT